MENETTTTETNTQQTVSDESQPQVLSDTNTQQTVSDEQTQELLLGKFKSVDDLAKSYKHLESKLGGFKGYPKDGYTTIEGLEDNPLIETLQDVAKELNMSQDGFEAIAKSVVETQEKLHEQQLREEIAKIPNYENRVKQVTQKALTVLRPDQIEALDGVVQTKESFEALEALIERLGAGSLPSNPPSTQQTEAELKEQMLKLNPADTDARARILKQINELYGDGEGRLV